MTSPTHTPALAGPADPRAALSRGGQDTLAAQLAAFYAERIRQLLKDIVVRLESVVPAAHGKDADEAKPGVKEEQQRSRRSRGRRRR